MNKPAQSSEIPDLPVPDERETALYRRFSDLRIAWLTHAHAPVFTVEEARHLRGSLPGLHTKNLFLEDRKGRFWLVVAREELAVDLNALAKTLPAPRFSFGKAGDLIRLLGVVPGAVSPFAVMNDRDSQVTVVLDEELARDGTVNFHPMRNDRTTAISSEALINFLEATGHRPIIVHLPERA
ncbi:MAG: prolyl-tRNA synthetase associated domain-containing protein [Alphaproteobacteria bacterium]|nr:prolyl-tRNA synthetase associated domain-containing protein [Alphaproteobacteria bacterium]